MGDQVLDTLLMSSLIALSEAMGPENRNENSVECGDVSQEQAHPLLAGIMEPQQRIEEGESHSEIHQDSVEMFMCPFPSCHNLVMTSEEFEIHHQHIHPVPASASTDHLCAFPHCGKAFSSTGDLTRHYRSHTGERPFACPYPDCGKTFSEAGNLRTHARVHTGEKPFACDHEGCDKRFAQLGHLSTHRLTHSRAKPVHCPYEGCLKTFTQTGSLTRHKRTHSGERPFVCDETGCGKTFIEASVLARHKVVHSGMKPYACDYEGCNKRYGHPGNLLVHRRTHIVDFHGEVHTVFLIDLMWADLVNQYDCKQNPPRC